MKNDTIYRQAAIDALTENKEMINAVLDSLTLDYNTRRNQEQRRGQINEDIEAIKALPSAQTEPQWIPCSVRPPKEKDGRVLITLDGEVTTATYSEFSKTWCIGDMCGVSDRVPTAWMPRPKPYKGEGNDTL